MKLLVGLGNPGKKYESTRHNMGFMLADRMADLLRASFDYSSKYDAECAEVRDAEHGKIFILKPQTYMNLSGQSVGPFAHFYKIDPQDIFVMFDDLDMPLGRIKLTRKGSAGGHNGIKSMIECLGSQEFPRIKMGIGRPNATREEVIDHVLKKFSKAESDLMEDSLERAADGVKAYLSEGLTYAMTHFNQKKRPDK